MISIIIVGYNSKKYLQECFESIFLSTYKKFNVIFVDNCSTDGSAKFVEENFPEVQTIISKINTGFAGGNNIAIKRAVELRSEYVFLLNPDTVIDEKCLEILMEHADQDTILQSLLLLHRDGQKTNIINSSGNDLNFLGLSYCGNLDKNAKIISPEPRNISLASGAAMFVATKVIRKIGLIDTDYFMYHEDVDFCWRARLAGFGIKLIPESIIWHKYNFSRNKNKLYYFERNRLLFITKNYPVNILFLIFVPFVIHEFLMIAHSIFNGWFVLKIQAYKDYFLMLPRFIRKRQKQIIKTKTKDTLVYYSSEIKVPYFSNPLTATYNLWLKTYWGIIKLLIG